MFSQTNITFPMFFMCLIIAIVEVHEIIIPFSKQKTSIKDLDKR